MVNEFSLEYALTLNLDNSLSYFKILSTHKNLGFSNLGIEIFFFFGCAEISYYIGNLNVNVRIKQSEFFIFINK